MDWNTDEGRQLAERLRKEQVIWLTTMRKDGMPTPTPVWFLWEGDTFLIYTLPGSLKLKNIAGNAHAALNLNSDMYGGSVAVFTGTISLAKDESPAIQNQAYMQKYAEGIKDIQMTPETFSRDYAVALRFRPTHTRVG